MSYLAYQLASDLLTPVRFVAGMAHDSLAKLVAWDPTRMASGLSATYEMVSRMHLSHHRPDYEIESVRIGNRDVAVTEEPASVTPFGTLLHFKKDLAAAQPRVLIVAPLSGHFATLLRATVRTLLTEHDVFITDWHNARDVGLDAGRFGFDEYVAHVIRFLEVLGPGTHVVSVCQPCVQVLAAASLMAQDNNPAQPRTMTLMAGPIDTRVNPTEVNRLATTHPIEWFERNLIATVPQRYEGRGRRVYPGFMQLTAFMAMNPQRHMKAHRDMYWHLAMDEQDKADTLKKFYDEYFAVLDMTAEFYLETVQRVFQDALLPQGRLTWRNTVVEPRAIRRTALLTVEGEQDDICSVGQTVAAQDLCSGLKPFLKRHHLQPGVGHYGVFAGRKWETQIYPNVRNMILACE